MHGVLTLAGEGSRMLPWSRGLRKEFLPLFDRSSDGQSVLKPVANLVFETLLESGIDDFILVVGGPDGGVTAQNYFTVDREFLERNSDRAERLSETARLYDAFSHSRIRFAVQPRPLGFGDAVLYAAPFVGADPFVLHAADAVLLERKRGRLPALMAAMRERDDLDVVLLVRKVAHPQNYGVIEGKSAGRVEDFRRLAVTGMEEKPAKPRSQWAATAVYCLTSRIFAELNQARAEDPEKELELTTGIVRLIQAGARVEALVINPRFAEWRSVGSPEGYARALNRTRRVVSGASSFLEPLKRPRKS
ncbi:MAG: sugar phosphate nucleotidyltransferase [Thermoplasmata archaeon]